MKTIINLFLLLVLPFYTFAQNEGDALLFSQNYQGATSRSAAMGGAFSALGGDFSTLSLNPAGLGVFRTTEIGVSTGLSFTSTKSTFFSDKTTKEDTKYNFNLTNLGLVGCIASGQDKGWVSVNFGFAYNQLANFNKNIQVQGTNTNSSMIDYFSKNAGTTSPTSLDAYYERLAFDTYLIDTVASGYRTTKETQYVGAGTTPRNVLQKQTTSTEGGIGEYAFSVGANYSNMIYFGASLGIQSLNYKETKYYHEINNNLQASTYDYSEFTFKENINTWGTGFNFKFGTIVKPNDWLRVSAAIHTPTFFSLTNEFYSEMSAKVHYVDDAGNENAAGYTSYSATPTDVNGNSIGKDTYKYDMTTPLKAVAGLAFILEKKALLTLDYEYIDYSQIRFSSDDYADLNSSIQETYKPTHNVRVGGEYRLDVFSFRAGYAYYGSPYKTLTLSDNSKRENGARNILSAGFGINQGDLYFDMSYMYSIQKDTQSLYDNVTANYTTDASRFMLTLGFRF